MARGPLRAYILDRMNNREFDIIVWGATGFTGALVAEYLLAQYGIGKDLRWAIAGRSEEKLEQLRHALGPDATALPTVIADSFDEQKLHDLAAKTRVVVTTVGPYAKYGSALVAACVEQGTHYCDLAGEAQWIRRMIDTHHEAAAGSGARIVHCCGFDSVPMDIGVHFLQQEAKRRYGEYCASIVMNVKAMRGTFSGGTMASMMNLVKEARADREVARVLMNPYGLNPQGERTGPDRGDQRGVKYDETAQAWTAPFIMAGINTKVVRRSHALQGYPYGEDFRYHEATMMGKGLPGWFGAAGMAAGLGGFVLVASLGPTRRLLERYLLPKPGEGPSREQRETGFFDLRQFGSLSDGTVVRTRITGDRDPGYGSTSKMLAESGVCLAKDELSSGGGVLTPAAAMGDALLGRLPENAGLTFEMLESNRDE